jgi:hypothetical protein
MWPTIATDPGNPDNKKSLQDDFDQQINRLVTQEQQINNQVVFAFSIV